jgi:hypothetical protein
LGVASSARDAAVVAGVAVMLLHRFFHFQRSLHPSVLPQNLRLRWMGVVRVHFQILFDHRSPLEGGAGTTGHS